ncbi:MAG: MGMT family protein [Bacteroidales bacterium]|nr:MGMT family protein [Bacteroidales bacterium]
MNKSFFERVYSVVREIPHGRVTTYGAIARSIGSPQAGRMVGWAMNKSFSGGEFIPAHRVVNRKGFLTGKVHFGGAEVMKQLLENEGIVVENDQILNFDKVFWDPMQISD